MVKTKQKQKDDCPPTTCVGAFVGAHNGKNKSATRREKEQTMMLGTSAGRKHHMKQLHQGVKDQC
jgi:hypothetical protein